VSTPAPKSKKPNLVSLTTLNADGSHYTLHPADVRGRFTQARRVFAFLLIGVYVVLPWIQINGAPAVFLDVEQRSFHLFGLSLAVQDLWVLIFVISGLGFSLLTITTVLGRLWCGWACPYTIFLEHVFRRIERWIDGDAAARRKLDAAPLSAGKFLRRSLKYSLYLIVSTLIAHVFLSYFVSLPKLYQSLQDGPLRHPIAFATVSGITAALLFCFGWFREQFCIILCPYGRLQSALTDEETLIIGYDAARGEPRGKASDPTAGACVDCRRCVQVCPTGIDIRNGLQMECVGCSACIDACDEIMTKLDRPTGLVRYDSASGLAGKRRRVLRPRLLVYSLLGLCGLIALGTSLFFRAKPILAEVSRMRGAAFFADASSVRNHYQIRLANKRNQPLEFKVGLVGAPAGFTLSGLGESIQLPANSEISRPLIVVIPMSAYEGPLILTLSVTAEPGSASITQKVEFLGPQPQPGR
jgi:cytochrome c oxidase accessory protein FixG